MAPTEKAAHAEALISQVREFHEQHFLTDIGLYSWFGAGKIGSDDGDGKEGTQYHAKAHRLVLSGASRLMAQILRTLPTEAEASLILPETSEKEVESLLSILYTGSARLDTSEQMEEMKKLTASLGIKDKLWTTRGGKKMVALRRSRKSGVLTKKTNKKSRSKRRGPERAHSDKKSAEPTPLTCQFCQMEFSRKCLLVNHLRSHTGERPFKCDQCAAAFTLGHLLKRHQRFHANIRPYKCQECECAFLMKEDLQKHKRRHSGEKPFPCAECGRRFARKDYLRKHLYTHVKQRMRHSMLDDCRRQLLPGGDDDDDGGRQGPGSNPTSHLTSLDLLGETAMAAATPICMDIAANEIVIFDEGHMDLQPMFNEDDNDHDLSQA